MDGLMEFFDMGKNSPFIWWSYGITGVVLAINAIWPMFRARRQKHRIERQNKLQRRGS